MMKAHDWLGSVVKFHEGLGPNLLDHVWICMMQASSSIDACPACHINDWQCHLHAGTFMSCSMKGKIQASHVAAVMRTIFTCQK